MAQNPLNEEKNEIAHPGHHAIGDIAKIFVDVRIYVINMYDVYFGIMLQKISVMFYLSVEITHI